MEVITCFYFARKVDLLNIFIFIFSLIFFDFIVKPPL